ncbi:cilia- and flagella-associated protein 43-like [Vespula squamosa]|uniref:Cilia- and flagella-associated protein 43-like n=1 Tax=Vespula squamosa TaxID=30214 RepID=A0ABD1ZXZ8_VESSQ
MEVEVMVLADGRGGVSGGGSCCCEFDGGCHFNGKTAGLGPTIDAKHASFSRGYAKGRVSEGQDSMQTFLR